ncbi:MAG: shikimate kinase [Bacteroidetes bacterium]|nr:shikimate kinase [Bacteroidota bacterium]
MKPNLTLIGMPGAGKSTIGIILAKVLSFGFVDTDILIQINRQKSLQEIIDESDHLNLRKIEEEEILKINVENQVIATGGSAVYSEKAMTHLKAISKIVFLKVDYREITRRIHNFNTRGIARPNGQTLYRDWGAGRINSLKYQHKVTEVTPGNGLNRQFILSKYMFK